MFAVIKTGGLQYRVATNDVVTVGKLAGEPGDIVELGQVLMIGGETVVVGSPSVEGATVAGEVVRQSRGSKVIAFKKRRRKNSKRKRGHRQDFTVVRITEILTDGRKPDMTARPRPEPKPAKEPAAAVAADSETAPGKPSAARKPKAGARSSKPTAKPKAKAATKGKKS
jgi:large subunit ribosomal protein L21